MKFNSLLADLRLSCPGMPEPWQYRFLTRSMQQFLSETQVWQEWTTYAFDFTAASGGIVTVPNARYNPTGPVDSHPYVRTDRILRVKWVPTGANIDPKPLLDLDDCVPTWMTDTGALPRFWTPWVSAFAGTTVPAARFTPFSPAIENDTAGALKFYVSHTIVELETPDQIYDLDVTLATSGMADWLFRRYRETILAGALAKALIVPNVDWSNAALSEVYAVAAAAGWDRARSEAQAGQTTRSGTVRYGGY